MKSKFLLAALIVATLFLAPSCGKKGGGSTGLLVPEDAAVVVHINSKSLGSKLSYADIRQTSWFREMSTDVSDSNAKKLFDDPSITGVDSESDFVFFMKKQGRGAYIAIEGSLKDEAKFAAYLKEHAKEAVESSKGEIKSLTFPDSKATVLSWDKSRFVFLVTFPMPDMNGMTGMGRRSYDADDDEPQSKLIPADSLIYFAGGLLNLSKSDRLDKDERFASLVNDGKDIHVWFSTDRYMRSVMGPSMLSQMGEVSVLFDGNVSASSFNFDNGKITMDSKQYYGAKMTSLLSKYEGSAVSEEMLNRLPSQNVIAALALNFKPEVISAILDLTKLTPIADMALSRAGISIKDIVKANKGDLMVAATDFGLTKKVDSIERFDGTYRIDTSTRPNAKWIFATSVGDKESFVKLIKVASQATEEFSGSGKMGISYKLENNWFTVGSSEEFLNQFIAGGNTKPAFAEKIKGHPMGMYIDLRKIWPVAISDVKDSSALKGLDLASKTWEDVVGYGGEIKDKALVFHAEVNMVDKTTNSLKQLNAFLDQAYQIAGPRIKAMKKDEFVNHMKNVDSLMEAPKVEVIK
jgi:hypothetical protein